VAPFETAKRLIQDADARAEIDDNLKALHQFQAMGGGK
jgi:hypothetical protein